MSPQFVDFDADGRLDIVAGTFDGSPHVAYGTEQGFRQPVQILDRDGQRIVMNQFWNFDTKKWDSTTRCDPEGVSLKSCHLTSAWAADWDADGDLDLLLGDHRSGHVMLRRNEGTAREPAFATRNELVLAEGGPLVVPGTVATLRTFDWDRDGLDDLVVGSMGDAYGEGQGGAVLVYRNSGAADEPSLGAPLALVAPSRKDGDSPVRPDSGLHMDIDDCDGDGDLDLVVGGYSHWTPPAPVLDEAQKQRVAELRQELKEVQEAMQAIWQDIEKQCQGLDEEAAEKKREELLAHKREELSGRSQRHVALNKELEPLVGGMKRRSFVWLYENLAKGRAAGAGSAK